MTRRTLPTLAAAACLLPAVALACPDSLEDSEAGVVVRYDDGVIARLSRDADAMVTEDVRYASSDDGYRTVALHGLFMIEDVDIEDGEAVAASQERQSFPEGLELLPDPETGLNWSGTVTVEIADLDPMERRISLGIGSRGEVMIGNCEYEAWPATLRYEDEGEQTVLGYDFLPALGIAILRSSADIDGEADLYTPVAISRVED